MKNKEKWIAKPRPWRKRCGKKRVHCDHPGNQYRKGCETASSKRTEVSNCCTVFRWSSLVFASSQQAFLDCERNQLFQKSIWQRSFESLQKLFTCSALTAFSLPKGVECSTIAKIHAKNRKLQKYETKERKQTRKNKKVYSVMRPHASLVGALASSTWLGASKA